MGSMSVMNRSGDSRIEWNKENAVEVEVARRTFEDLRKKGYQAYPVQADGTKGETALNDPFDPSVERYILAPALSGG